MTHPLIRKLENFTPLAEGERQAVLDAIGLALRFGPRENIVREGGSADGTPLMPDGLVCVLEGLICRYKLLPDGRRQILAYLVPGDLCDLRLFILKQMDHGIATLAPGKKYRTFFDMGFRRNEDRPDLPMNYVARVRYSDERGKRSFDETLNLDMDQYMHISTVTRHDLHDIHGQLERIRKVIEKWG